MKNRLLFLALLAALFLTGCGKGDAFVDNAGPAPDPDENPVKGEPDSKPAPKLLMASADESFDIEDSNGVYIQFAVNVDWTITMEYEGSQTGWLTASPESGHAGEYEVALIAQTNTTGQERAVVVCLNYGDQTYRLKIIQGWKGGPKLQMRTPSTEYLDAEGESDESAFEVNRDWEITVDFEGADRDWLSVSPQNGSAGVGVLSLIAAANPSGAERKARIIISYDGREHTIHVIQQGLNLADRFDPQFAQELQKRGYIKWASKITPEEVKGIKTLQMHGGWNAVEQKYMGKLTSLRGIEYFESLTDLTCWGNQLTELDVSHNKNLKELYCYNNQLASLDVSHNPDMIRLSCRSNLLTELDVSLNPKMVDLDCGGNMLSELDIISNQGLVYLCCDHNRFTTLHIVENAALKTLMCEFNQLTSLDMSRNRNLSRLTCFQNPGDGSTFPIRSWFDNETIPQHVKDPDGERTPLYSYTTNPWVYQGHEIKPDYRKVE